MWYVVTKVYQKFTVGHQVETNSMTVDFKTLSWQWQLICRGSSSNSSGDILTVTEDLEAQVAVMDAEHNINGNNKSDEQTFFPL